jgi:hypothetical protein
VIDDSDYYVIVIGARYGSVTATGISFTEREFEYALALGLPILAFLHEHPEDLAIKNSDQNDQLREKLDAFRRKLKTGRHVKFWTTAHDLQAKVIQAIAAETKRNPRTGWLRADQSGDPARLNKLIQENERLTALLHEARTMPPPGTQEYAQGSDKYTVHFKTKMGWSEPDDWHELKLTWDQIFYEVGPLIMGEIDDRALRVALSQEMPAYLDQIRDQDFKSVDIDNDSFQTIKVQLLALGLMQKSTSKRPPSDTRTYWAITPYGEQYLTKLRAIKREPLPLT